MASDDKYIAAEFSEVVDQIIDPKPLIAQETGVVANNPPIQTMDNYLAGNIFLMDYLGTKKWLSIYISQIERIMASSPDASDREVYQELKTNRRTWLKQQARFIQQVGSEVWLIQTITELVGFTPKFDRAVVWERVEGMRAKN